MAPVFAYHAPGVGKPPRRLVGSIVAAAAVAVGVAALGAGIGWIWSEVAPRVAVIKADKGFYYADAEPEQAVAADGWFAIIGVLAGAVVAILAWYLLRRYRGSAVLVGLTLGSLAGAALAWWVGIKIGMAQFDQVRETVAAGARVNAPLGLRITELNKDHPWTSVPNGVAAIQALAAAAVYTLFSGFSGYPDLRGDPVPAYQPLPGYQVPPLSSDQAHQWASLRSSPVDQPLSFNQQTLSYDQPSVLSDPTRPPDPPAPNAGPGQFGPGFTGSSDSATGTART